MKKREEGGREIELKMVIEEGSIKSGTFTSAHILCVTIYFTSRDIK